MSKAEKEKAMDKKIFNRIDGLVSQANLNSFKKATQEIISDLSQTEGFEMLDIIEYLAGCIKAEADVLKSILQNKVLAKKDNLRNLAYTRKASDWAEIKVINISEEIKQDANALPLINGNHLECQCDDVILGKPKRLPQYFRLLKNDTIYLVNTEGYDYCRYIGILETAKNLCY